MNQKLYLVTTKKHKTWIACISISIIFLLTPATVVLARQKPVVIGYVSGLKGIVKTNLIAANKLNYIDYAFADIKNYRV